MEINLNNEREISGKPDLVCHHDPEVGQDKHIFKIFGEQRWKETRPKGVACAEVKKNAMEIRGPKDEILGLDCPKEIYCNAHDLVAVHSQANVDKNSATVNFRMPLEQITVNESFATLHRVLSNWALKRAEKLKNQCHLQVLMLNTMLLHHLH